MELGMRKIPDPMMVPTTTATPSKKFNSFRKMGGQPGRVSCFLT